MDSHTVFLGLLSFTFGIKERYLSCMYITYYNTMYYTSDHLYSYKVEGKSHDYGTVTCTITILT